MIFCKDEILAFLYYLSLVYNSVICTLQYILTTNKAISPSISLDYCASCLFACSCILWLGFSGV